MQPRPCIVCACVCVCCVREERKRKRGGRWQQARPAKGEREGGKEGEMSACGCGCAVRQPQHVNTLRHFATFGSSSSRCGLLHRNVTSDSLSSSGKQAPKQTNQKSKTPRSHTGSTTHVIRDPKPDPFGASSSSSQAHLLQTLLAPTCDLVVPLPLC